MNRMLIGVGHNNGVGESARKRGINFLFVGYYSLSGKSFRLEHSQASGTSGVDLRVRPCVLPVTGGMHCPPWHLRHARSVCGLHDFRRKWRLAPLVVPAFEVVSGLHPLRRARLVPESDFCQIGEDDRAGYRRHCSS